MGQASLRVIENTSMDKNKALEAALSQIERAFGKGSIMKLGANTALAVESISTGSLGLDIALGIGGHSLPPLRHIAGIGYSVAIACTAQALLMLWTSLHGKRIAARRLVDRAAFCLS